MLLFYISSAAAANFYVHKGASGSNNGTSWTAAWSEMSSINFSSVACGDTIWLAGGTYTTTMTVAKSCTSGSPLYIKRVLSTDSVPVASPGWSSSFDSQVIFLNWSGFAGIRLNGINYVTIDGRFGNPLGASPVPYGISLQCTISTGCDEINDGNGNNNSTLINMELYGPPCVETQSCTGAGASGVNLPYGGTGMTFQNLYIHRVGEGLRAANWVNATIQYCYLADFHNDSAQHEDVLYDNGGSGQAVSNLVMRYNTIWMSPNDGIFFDGGYQNGVYIYGNVYYHSGGALITFKNAVGVKAVNVFIYNNTFENDGTFGDFQPGWLDVENVNTSSGAFQNNIMQQMFLIGTPPSPNYNAYDTSGNKDSGAHSFVYTPGTQFIATSPSNPLLANFRLTANGGTTFAPGIALSSPYNLDMDGHSRGTPTWTVGAYQYLSSPVIGPPTNLTGTVQLSGAAAAR